MSPSVWTSARRVGSVIVVVIMLLAAACADEPQHSGPPPETEPDAGVLDNASASPHQLRSEGPSYDIVWEGSASAVGSKGAFVAPNPSHRIEARFADGATEVSSISASPGAEPWAVGVELERIGYEGATHEAKSAGDISVDRSGIFRPYDGVWEWFFNTPGGLEHGFTLQTPPEQGTQRGERVVIEVEIDGDVDLEYSEREGRVIFRDPDDGGRLLSYGNLAVWDATERVLTAEMTVAGDDTIQIAFDDTTAVYPITVDPTYSTEIKRWWSAANAYDKFGWNADVDGEWAVVGTIDDDDILTNLGTAFIYGRDIGGANNWGLHKQIFPSNQFSYQIFGNAVDIDGSTMIVGGPGNQTSNEGVAFIFEEDAGGTDNWGEVKALVQPDGTGSDRFGNWVAVDGDVAAVGSPLDDDKDPDAGTVFVFHRDQGGAGNWGFVRKLLPEWVSTGALFGLPVEVRDDLIFVGAPGHPDGGSSRGKVFIHQRNAGGTDNWGRVRQFGPSPDYSEFGHALDYDDGVLAMSAWKEDHVGVDSGVVYLYYKDANGPGTWGLHKTIVGSNVVGGDQFGNRIQMHGDLLVVSTKHDDSKAGSAYVFQRHAGGKDNWGQVNFIQPTDPAAGDEYGFDVSIQPETLLVSAARDDVTATESGSAYFYPADPVCTGATEFCLSDVDCLDPADACSTTEALCGTACSYDSDCAVGEVCTGGACLPARDCYTGPAGTEGIGECSAGYELCTTGYYYTGLCEGEVTPVAEVCGDGLDNDCDDIVDEGCFTDCPEGAVRSCGTNVGECETGTQTCSGGTWGECTGGTGPSYEFCDGLDNDCDFEIDEGCAASCLDGQVKPCGQESGACKQGEQVCRGGKWGKCEKGVSRDAETCGDGIDNNCDGRIDEGCDVACVDGESRACGSDVGACVAGTETCNDGVWGPCTGETSPYPETCGDSIDNDCDGSVDEGCDVGCTDGNTRSCGTSTGECTTGTETCDQGIWGPCVGATYPETETCDGLDNDCDGTVDDGTGGGSCTSAGTGECAKGTEVCSSGSITCEPGTASTEVCDGLDNDCDGSVDEGTGTDADGDGSYDCVDCDDSDPDRYPGATEVCDGFVDENCDGTVDEGCGGCVCDTVEAFERYESTLGTSDSYGTSTAWDGEWIVVGAPDAGTSDKGRVYVYRETTSHPDGNGWGLYQTLQGGSNDQSFGESVDIDGTTIVIGDSGYDTSTTNVGAAYVYDLDGTGTWVMTRRVLDGNPESGSEFGFAVTIDGDTAVVGAPGRDKSGPGPKAADTGSIHVLRRDSGGFDNWGEITSRVYPDAVENGRYGQDVDYDEAANIGIAGVTGKAYIFDDTATTHIALSPSVTSAEVAPASFGVAVAVDGGVVVVGDPDTNYGAGRLHVFEQAASWAQTDKAQLTVASTGADLGRRLRFEETWLAVAAPGYSTGVGGGGEGAVFLYRWDGTALVQQSDHGAPTVRSGDTDLGLGLGLRGTGIAAGAPFYDATATESGSMWVFETTVCTETCGDGADNDCDGVVDNGCCPDADGDGYLDASCGGKDCDDTDPNINPGAEDICGNGIDENCDGIADGGCGSCVDSDGDTYNAYDATDCPSGTDCDDTDASIHPGAFDGCDLIDNDCDGVTDEGETETCDLLDNDCDGEIDESDNLDGDPYEGGCGTDCNDYDASIYPGAPEWCDDGLDTDCDGDASSTEPDCIGPAPTGCVDNDGDGEFGYDATTCTTGLDCHDNDSTVNTSATESCNGYDDNCDGQIDEGCTPGVCPVSPGIDDDGDGYDPSCEVQCGCDYWDCDDTDPNVNMGATEICGDGIDNDCDLVIDEESCEVSPYPQCIDADGDGYINYDPTSCPSGTDCDDSDPAVNPGASEVCGDSIDNDCNGTVDDGCGSCTDGNTQPCYTGPAGTEGVGVCVSGTQTCSGGVWGSCDGEVLPRCYATTEAKLLASDGAASDHHGIRVDVDGDIAVVGADLNDAGGFANGGAAYVYYRNQGGIDAWGEVKKLVAPDVIDQLHFGISVRVKGDLIAVGATFDDDKGTDAGAVYLFEKDLGGADNWGFLKKLTASDGAAGDYFGESLYLDRDVLAVGAVGDDDLGTDAGAAYVFERNLGGTDFWGEAAKLLPATGAAGDAIGDKVAVSGTIVAVGAPNADGAGTDAGAVHIFERDTTVVAWNEVTTLTGADTAGGDNFGSSVAMSGDLLAVGADRDDDLGTDAGAAYLFDGASGWAEVTKLTASNGAAGDDFGYSIDIDGNMILVGSRGASSNGTDSGAGYVFERNTDGAGVWGEAEILLAFDGASGDVMGISAGLSQDVAILGAFHDDDLGSDAGSAFVFGGIAGGTGSCVADSCDGLDNDCDGTLDEGADIDGDGETTCGGDCDDSNPAIYSTATDVCDGIDNDCDGAVDEGSDADGDGVTTCGGDCDDSDNTVYPGAPELCDSLDNDCDGAVDEHDVDADGDGVTVCSGDCDDTNTAVYPGAPELCDGLDNDCDGTTDESPDADGDGVTICGGDCDDSDGTVYPGQTETCNGVDDDCDGVIDDGVSCGECDELKRVPVDLAADDDFGNAADMDGSWALVGSRKDDDLGSASGSAYIFGRDVGGTWKYGEFKKLVASDGVADDQYGYAVSISSDVAVVAAPYHDTSGVTNSGAVYVYLRDQGGVDNWGLLKKLAAPTPGSGDRFGFSVSTNGSVVAVGEPDDDGLGTSAGAVYVFGRDVGGANNFGLVRKITASDGEGWDYFGWSIEVAGNSMVVGAWQDGSAVGSAYVFDKDQGGIDNWGEVKKLTAFDGEASDWFGHDVTIDGDTIAVGADGDDDLGTDAGAAYVYGRDIGGANNWGLVEKITASDGSANSQFGLSVELAGDQLVSGAQTEDSAGTDAGASYLYARNLGGTNAWGEIRKIVATDVTAGAWLGGPSALLTDVALLGARFQDNQGAVYFYPLAASCTACTSGNTRSCYTGPSGTENVGECVGGTETCSTAGVWGTCDGQVLPATEVCDGLDNDCDSSVDENSDGDGDGYTSCGGDCNDSDASINPAASETCDGIDNNCDSIVDEGCCGAIDCVNQCNNSTGCGNRCAVYDAGGDLCYTETCGNSNQACQSCSNDCSDNTVCDPSDSATCTTSCNTFDGSTCVASDCTSAGNNYCKGCDDADGDGYSAYHPTYCPSGTDCFDDDAAIHPGAVELCGDNVDNDCDGAIDENCGGCVDGDGDGYFGYDASVCAGGQDCDDAAAGINPGAAETCGDSIDNNCDGQVDEGCGMCADNDGDGYDGYDASACTTGTDCDDTDIAINPGASEVCDGLDNDCNGAVDDMVTDCGTDVCSAGECVPTCSGSGFTSLWNDPLEVAWDSTFADFNGDGTPDLAMADGSIDGNRVYLGDGAGGFTQSWKQASVDDSQAVEAGDLDGDGDVDLLFGRGNGSARANTVWLNDGTGVFTAGWTASTTEWTIGMDLGDVDGDGDLDVAFANTGTSSPADTVLLNDGNGNFSASWTSPDVLESRDVTLADVNGDGNLDLAVAYSDSATGEAKVFAGDGAGGFTEIWASGNNGSYRSVEFGDYDLDGDLDLLTATPDSAVRVWANDGAGAFSLAWSSTLAASTHHALFVDIDNDGWLDIAGANDDPNQPNRIYRSDGVGGFDETYWTSVEQEENLRVDVADIDADGDQDIIFSAWWNWGTWVYENGCKSCDPETCDGVDNDCDGVIDNGFDVDGDGMTSCNGDCNDSNSAVYTGAPELCDGLDNDCDGTVDEGFDTDGDGETSCGGDCDDSDPTINTSATEVCDGVDNDCDGGTDEGFDTDADGYTTCNGDCDDTDDTINPASAEACDGVDNDCDGSIDEGFDGDGDGETTCAGDCDDTDPAINTSATEVCDGVDNNCDGAIDEGFDTDGDTYTTCAGDCDDTDPAINPAATEVCDGVDNDCNGSVDEGFDTDGDGYTSCGGDCDDTDAAINPAATEVCDSVDNNCDGNIDEGFDTDGDGVTTCGGDCDDTASNTYPGAPELCDGVDNDCDSTVDEGFDTDGDGQTTCAGDCDDTDPSIYFGATEVCNSVDDDCDGTVDEGFDVDGDTYTSCGGDCDDSDPNIKPGAAEICDGVDNNCDGAIDEGYDADADGYTSCGGDCDDTEPLANPGELEACDGIDNNCDGVIDEGYDGDGDGYTSCGGDCDDTDPAVNPGATEVCNNIDDDCSGAVDDAASCDTCSTCGGATPLSKFFAPDTTDGDQLGYPVDMDADVLVAGARYDDDMGADSGSAYVYHRDQGGADNWGLVRKLTAPDGTAGDRFAEAVAVSGDWVVVGAIFETVSGFTDAGAAYVYNRNQGGTDNWGFVQKLTSPSPETGARFGDQGLAVDGDVIAVGARYEDVVATDSGGVHVFLFDGTSWVYHKVLTAPGTDADDRLGADIAIDGPFLAIGNNNYDKFGADAGGAFVYDRGLGGIDNFGLVKEIAPPTITSTENWFGRAIDIEGSRLAVAAKEGDGTTDPGYGAVYIFEEDVGGTDNWGQVAKAEALDQDPNDTLGVGIALDGNVLAAGAYLDDEGATDAGAAYLFGKDEGGTDNWGQITKYVAADATANQGFGTRVGLVGNYLAVGASKDDEVGADAGAIYMYGSASCPATMTCSGCTDADGDGYAGISGSCGSGTDCDDTDATIFPGALEVCDTVDNDCDGTIDEEPDASSSCSDADACTTDTCSSGTCSSTATCAGTVNECGCTSCTDCDLQDGWYDVGSTYACCDGAGSACTCQDQEYRDYDSCVSGSCDYTVTNTQTLESGCALCDDSNVCTDDSCSSGSCVYADNAYSEPCYTGPAGTEGVGECTAGTQTCSGGTMGACTGEVTPTTEVCDGLDNDCDGTADDSPDVDADCDDGNTCTTDICSGGVCSNTSTCSGTDTDCGCASCTDCNVDDGWYNVGSTYACCDGTGQSCTCQDEELRDYYCNGTGCDYIVTSTNVVMSGCASCDDGNICTDDSCNSGSCVYSDNAYSEPCYTGPAGTEGVGECTAGTQTCSGGTMGSCTGEVTPTAETCDALDNDCNGTVDDGTASDDCAAGQTCHWGACFDDCTATTDCTTSSTGDTCYVDDGRCDGTDPCAQVTCPAGETCVGGTCYPTCTDSSQCDPTDEVCYQSNRCGDDSDPCLGIQCPDTETCEGGTCYPTCSTNSDCLDPTHVCYDATYCAADPCDGIDCPVGEFCEGGTCFQGCTTDVDCTDPSHACYDSRCAPDPCYGIKCASDEMCHQGSCFQTCTSNADCSDPNHVCYDATYCATNACDGVICEDGESCHAGTCFQDCTTSVDCTDPSDICYDNRCTTGPCDGVKCAEGELCDEGVCYQTCTQTIDCTDPSHFCYNNFCQDPCDGVTCPAGESCFAGSCYQDCATDVDCTDMDDVCYDSRCVDEEDPWCDGVTCPMGEACYRGTCWEDCGDDADCSDPDSICYQGHCAPDDCDGVVCDSGETCHDGICYETCGSDVDCTDPSHRCWDSRCANSACEAMDITGMQTYDADHVFHEVDHRLFARQFSTPWTWPRPVEGGSSESFESYVNVASGTGQSSGATVHAPQKARVIMFLDRTRSDDYVLWLTHGDADATQLAAQATYSIVMKNIDPEIIVTDDNNVEAVRESNTPDNWHQVEALITTGPGETGGVGIGIPESDEGDWEIQISANFAGDIDGWEVYDADNGGAMVELTETEPLTITNIPFGDSELIAPRFGYPCDTGKDGICRLGTSMVCENWGLKCSQTVSPWDFEVCDGRDNTCDGTVDGPISKMRVPQAYFTQTGLSVSATGQTLHTGTDAAGAQSSGAVDPDWKLDGGDATTRDPASGWIAENGTSKWLDAPGTQTFSIDFDIPAGESGSASITGRAAADDEVTAIRLNGNDLSVPSGLQGGSWDSWTSVNIGSGFVDGTNTLEFVVDNSGGGEGGFRAELTLSGTTLSAAWYPWPTVDDTGSVNDFMNYTPRGSGDLLGSTNVLRDDGTPLQGLDESWILAHRDDDGQVSFPIVHGAAVSGGSDQSREIDVGPGTGHNIDETYVCWYDDRAPGSTGDRVLSDYDRDRRYDMDFELDENSGMAESDSAVLRAVWLEAYTGTPVQYWIRYNDYRDYDDMIGDPFSWQIYTPKVGDVTLSRWKRLRVKVEAAQPGSSFCISDVEDDGCWIGQYTCNAATGAIECGPGIESICTSGCVDNDGDGHLPYNPTLCPAGDDCDDTNADIYPGAPEICDGYDNDCDGQIDVKTTPGCANGEAECGPDECNNQFSCRCPDGPQDPGDPVDKCFCGEGLTP